MNTRFNIAAVAAGAGYLLLAALIWYVGPLVGLTSTSSRLLGIGILVAIGVAALIGRHVLARRSGGLIARMLRRQADEAVIDARPERRAEVAALRQGLLSAIATLRQSRIGEAGGNAALYELPWYMVIGHPAAGKSSAVLNSGLTFPLADKHGVQGVGGTRHCDWFFAAEGVLLDTAGRYATQSEDRAEWLAFLKLLKRHRSRAPVNGILVAVSLTELADWRSERFAVYARQIRERIHEIDAAFGLQVPIYLVVTKLDLLAGFAQFFSHLPPEERTRVWGATLEHDQGGDFDAARVVGQHFDALCEGLREMSEERLAASRGRRADASLFAFPIEFHALRDALWRFVELLHEDDPYHARPLLRGFYLTSALQHGAPQIATSGRVAERFALARGSFENRQSPTSYSYFLRDLFREVLFLDQHLIARQTRSGRSRWRLAGLAGGLTMLAVLSAALTWAFVGNQKLMDAARAESLQAAELIASAHLLDRLGGLLLLQRRLEEFQRYREHGHPWRIDMGLYRGEPLEAMLRKQYFAGLRTVMLAPVKASLEETLSGRGSALRIAHRRDEGPSARPGAPVVSPGLPIIPLPGRAVAAPSETPTPTPGAAVAVSEPVRLRPRGSGANLEHTYNALKTYLMLHEQARMEQAHLSDQLPRHWRPWLEQNRGGHDTDAVIALAERVAAFYVGQLGAPDLPLIDNEQQVVERARGVLRGSLQQMSATERVYNELKTRANTRFAPLSVSRILAGKDAGIVGGSVVVPGAFTREAWEQYLRRALRDMSRGGIKSDDWVLAVAHEDSLGSGAAAERNRLELEALYRDEFARAWTEFLQGVAVLEQGGLAETAGALARLADLQSSPIRLLLVRMAHETSWDNEPAASALAASPSGPRTALVESDATSLSVPHPPQLGPLGREFETVSAIAGEAGAAAMSGYLEQLSRVRGRLVAAAGHDDPASVARQLMHSTLEGSGSELAQALQYVDGVMLASAGDASRRMLRPILVRPLMLAYGALIPPVEQDLNQAWQREIYSSWRTLADKYPFSDTGHDAVLADIARFTRPNGTLARFVDRHLDGLVVRRGEQLAPRTWGSQGLRLNASFLSGVGRLSVLGDKLSQDGADGRFELQPVPTPGLSEISVEIGGKMLRYRNGPQPWQEFRWPGEDDRHGARIQVVDLGGVVSVVANQTGRMGFLRLLGDASKQEPGDGTAQLAWHVEGERSDRTVKLRFRNLAGVSPLQLSSLRRLSLPERITP
ncbi:type VI secretion system membrane subunit TssM [Aromatoleum sp.]|uniref:type VI secretion system membrane subunit TssM n=1 Tax=Aromatoleum sp. TaxID=2307007 RepID=UPI002FCBFB44